MLISLSNLPIILWNIIQDGLFLLPIKYYNQCIDNVKIQYFRLCTMSNKTAIQLYIILHYDNWAYTINIIIIQLHLQ